MVPRDAINSLLLLNIFLTHLSSSSGITTSIYMGDNVIFVIADSVTDAHAFLHTVIDDLLIGPIAGIF